jgi:hypothetical protein
MLSIYLGRWCFCQLLPRFGPMCWWNITHDSRLSNGRPPDIDRAWHFCSPCIHVQRTWLFLLVMLAAHLHRRQGACHCPFISDNAGGGLHMRILASHRLALMAASRLAASCS